MPEHVKVQERLNALRMFIASKSPGSRYENFDTRATLSLSNYILKKLRSCLSEKDFQLWTELAMRHHFHVFQKILTRQEIQSHIEKDELEVELQLLAYETAYRIRFYRNDRSGLYLFQIRKIES